MRTQVNRKGFFFFFLVISFIKRKKVTQTYLNLPQPMWKINSSKSKNTVLPLAVIHLQ